MIDANLHLKRVRAFTLWTSAILLSLLLNVLFFSLLPELVSSNPPKPEDKKRFHVVNVVRVKKQETPAKKKEIKKPEKRKDPQKNPLQNPIVRKKPLSRVPKLPFELNLKLSAGPGTLPTFPMEMVPFDFLGMEGAYGIGDLDGPLTPLAQIPPLYPLRAKRLGIEGWVKVQFVVTERGVVDQIEIIGWIKSK
ncbi:MAG: energy transducer TonB [Deltaproteobacteria bacterium]|nr:energy transducer TonB [Deltaproteobacteria bacterium]